MGFIIYGSKKAIIGAEETHRYCQSCEINTESDIMISSIYYHIYFVPIFPFDKEMDVICQRCGLKTYGISFNAKNIHHYEEIKSKYKHPWYTYTVVGFFALMIVLAIILR